MKVEKTKQKAKKRVELHMHTNMSVMDATNSPSDLISQAAKWGHKQLRLQITPIYRPTQKHMALVRKTALKFYTD